MKLTKITKLNKLKKTQAGLSEEIEGLENHIRLLQSVVSYNRWLLTGCNIAIEDIMKEGEA